MCVYAFVASMGEKYLGTLWRWEGMRTSINYSLFLVISPVPALKYKPWWLHCLGKDILRKLSDLEMTMKILRKSPHCQNVCINQEKTIYLAGQRNKYLAMSEQVCKSDGLIK